MASSSSNHNNNNNNNKQQSSSSSPQPRPSLLAGLKSLVTDSGPTTAHGQFIHGTLLPLLTKVQRELRSRKHKDVQTKLQEAILVIKAFQNEEWPRKPTVITGNTTDNTNHGTASLTSTTVVEEEDDDDVSVLSEAVTSTTTEGGGTAAAPMVPSVGESYDPEDDEQSIYATVASDAPPTTEAAQLPNQNDENGERRQPPPGMDPAVVQLLEALMRILQHVHRPTARAIESGLEAIQKLVQHRYVSGAAGGAADDDDHATTRKLTDHSEEETGRGVGNPNVDTAAAVTGDSAQGGRQQQQPQASILHRLLESLAKAAETSDVNVHNAVIATVKAVVTSPVCGVHETSMLLALRSMFHVYLVSKNQACQSAARKALLEILQSVFRRMEAYEAVARHQANHKKTSATEAAKVPNNTATTTTTSTSLPVHVFASQYHSDSYVLFRALCKLSSKELPVEKEGTTAAAVMAPRLFAGNSAGQDPLALHSKILALELILAAFDYCGEAFYNGERFIHLVQHYLCVSLLKNCMSNHTQVAFLSQKIFLVLVYKFKVHLKQEIEVFLSNIFLRVLDSPNASFKQKALVLESLRSLCQDTALLTQLFLHYDCDMAAMNLYKDIVLQLTRLAGKATSNPNRTEQEWELSLAGLEVLVTILKSNLRSLGLPVADEAADDRAGAKIRGMLQLDVGPAAAVVASKTSEGDAVSVETSSLGDDISLVEHPTTSGAGAAAVSGGGGTAEPNGATSSEGKEVAERIVDAFDRKRNAEQNFEIGAVKFTLSLKGGLNFFIENGLVKRTAKDIAVFFLQHKHKLDKTQMGEAMGREPDAAFVKDPDVSPQDGGVGFWTLILHHYVDELDFTDMVFDDAIRLFLSGFRLPGEAQKIDRIMEKFAQKFTAQNPSVFSSADTAFILAFSVIMLNTDLHNPSIKPERRMTLENFVGTLRGIGENGSDLPREMLEGIYGRIKERPFSLKEDDAARERAQKQIFDTSVFFEGSALFGASAEQRKRETFQKEKDEMMATTEQLMRRRPQARTTTVNEARLHEEVTPADVVKPMFDITWGPLLGILSQVLECFEDERSTAVCLNGFVYAVRIASRNGMSLARDTFVSSLAKFTFLGSIKNMKRKNIESVRTLLSIAVIDGEYLGASWEPVLQCISQIARLRLSASGLDSDESFLSPSRKRSGSGTDRAIFRQTASRENLARETEESNGKAVLEAVQEVLIDKVFDSTVNLSAKTLAHFIEQLIAVSESEIAGNFKRGITGVDSQRSNNSTHGGSSGGPSIYSLQRLVDVADFNMDVRPRLVWAQVWEMMANYFARIACHENANVSVFAIDSLKQLSFKFLDKPELTEFSFQRTFLKPFLVVMEDKSSRDEVREMVLHCIDNMIRTKSHNLRSGWKVVFSILDSSASDPSEKIDFLGLGILQRLLDEHLSEICELSDTEDEDVNPESLSPAEARHRNYNVEDFVELCRASLSFVGKEDTDSPRPFGLAMRAFVHTGLYADLLAAKRVLPPISGAQSTDPKASGYTYAGLSDRESLEMAPWRSLLEGLAEGVRSSVRNVVGGVGCLVQRGSILALRAIMLRHGHLFSVAQLSAIIEQTIVPAIQAGAESDHSTVVSITSESPAVSSVDFLSETPPLPPSIDDPSLEQFRKDLESSSNRALGPSELMLEASFTVLRNGGDGDLRMASALAKRGSDVDRPEEEEQPFPESWIATTSPGALGLLTDIATEVALYKGKDGRDVVWKILSKQYSRWYCGSGSPEGWNPCEALVRVSCKEMQTFANRIAEHINDLNTADKQGWSSCVMGYFAETLLKNASIQDRVRRDLVRARQGSSGEKQSEDQSRPVSAGNSTSEEMGDPHENCEEAKTEGDSSRNEDQDAKTAESDSARKSDEDRKPVSYDQISVSALKIRAVAAHLTTQSILNIGNRMVPFVSKYAVADMLEALNKSRTTSADAAVDRELSMAFQEALLSDWGGEIADLQDAIESTDQLSQLHGSAMFFLTQESGATQAALHVLSTLYNENDVNGATEWEKEGYAESNMFYIMNDVLDKFLLSERKDGHLIEPNVWRNAGSAGGVKVAYYCTSFIPVVLEILSTIGSMNTEQFSRHKQEIFPRLCALVRVRSDEVRESVHDVLMEQIGPLIQVHKPVV